MIGFVHHLVARRGEEIIGYSHMMAISAAQQNQGVGARLKWAQRARALAEKVNYIKWTWDPMQARNAHFNLNRLGAIVRSYAVNFYGTDYPQHQNENKVGLNSDRLFAEWHLDSSRVQDLARGEKPPNVGQAAASVRIPANWKHLIDDDVQAAHEEQQRVRAEFAAAFADNLVCAAFERDEIRPQYLFFRERDLLI
jgi:predicted GNAT superfamily acetyltransferase